MIHLENTFIVHIHLLHIVVDSQITVFAPSPAVSLLPFPSVLSSCSVFLGLANWRLHEPLKKNLVLIEPLKKNLVLIEPRNSYF